MIAVQDNEEELYAQLKELPDFECFPLPERWFKKFNIPPVKAEDPKSFMEYKLKETQKHYDLPPIIIDEPQRNGELFKVFPPEEIKVDIVSREFKMPTSGMFPATLPYLQELAEKEMKREVTKREGIVTEREGIVTEREGIVTQSD